MPQLPSQWNNDVQAVSMQPASGNPEYKIPLWWSSGTVASNTVTVESGIKCVKGNTGMAGGTTVDTKLHTLSSNWPVSTKFSFEATISHSSATVNAAIWDFTAGGNVASSQISVASTTLTVVRSSQFTLIPGRVYGVELWGSSAGTSSITDASLIVFPQ